MRLPVRYFAPGPVWVDPEVRKAMTRPIVPHRSPEFKKLWTSIGERLKLVFRTRRDVLIATSSATFALEAALVSLAPRSALSLVNGAFSERWLAIARSRGIASEELAVPWGSAVDPDRLRARLKEHRPEVVTMVHCETSTGVLNPIAALARVVREESDALVLVDAVSSLAGTPVESDDWGLDVVVTASQKALGLPPGLAIFSVSDRAWERMSRVETRGFYTDFLRYRAKHAEGGPITTPAIPLIYALDAQLERILDEGLEARWERHVHLRDLTEKWAAAAGFEYASDEGARSPTVSCLKTAPELAPTELVDKLAQQGFLVGGGYGRLKESTFRIGHMAEIGSTDLELLFEAVAASAANR
ncbi:MAG: alanine--glyoxylate aminotransferase family protein [bacterium]|nr:alanine--glyoxylate aminotransferase family protein [bacterium]